MKHLLSAPIITISFLLAGVSFAEENTSAAVPMPARVIGEISDGSPSPPVPPKVLPNYEVEKSKVHNKGGRRIILNRVTQPLPVVKAEAKLGVGKTPVPDSSLEQGGVFIVHATVYDDHLTHVKWGEAGHQYEAWSNANFKLLEGFHRFEGRGKSYTFMMLRSAGKLQKLREAHLHSENKSYLPEIPDFTELEKRKTAAYMLMKGDERDEVSMEFMEAIHDLYETEYQRLVNARNEREKNYRAYLEQREELMKNPPPKPDVIINYWKKAPTVKNPSKPVESNK